MLGKQFLRSEYEVVDEVGCLLGSHASLSGSDRVTTYSSVRLHKQRTPWLVWMVMGWGTYDMLVTSLDDQQVAVLYTSNESHPVTAQVFIQIFNEDAGIICFQISPIMGDNLSILQSDDITTDGKVIISHLIAYRSSFQRTASLIYLVKVIAENGSVGNLRTGREALGYSDQPPGTTFLCQLLHVLWTGILQQGLITQSGDRMVCHAVA